MITFGKQLFFFAFLSLVSKICTSIRPLKGLISTKSIFAPQYNAQFADATKEIGEVQTISFFLTPRARQERCNALVALLTTMAY